MKKLTKSDAKKYLQFGELTKKFLEDEYVIDKVMHDYNYKISIGKKATKIESLMAWINHCVVWSKDDKFNKKYKFNRTAQEIWESKIVTGCTDMALLFCTFARQIEIPTTFLHAAELDWLKNLLDGKDCQMHKGHSFCECFYDGKWILVDPTCKKIVYDYDADKIVLPYKNLGSDTFIPYFRGLDLEHKMTLKEHNDFEELLCKKVEKE